MKVILVGNSQDGIKLWPSHSHQFWELIYNTTGKGKMLVDGEEFPFNKGDIFLIPPQTPHIKFSDFHYRDIFIQVDDERLKDKKIVFSDDREKTILNLLNIANRLFHKNDFSVLESLWEVIFNLIFSESVPSKRDTEVEQLKNILIDNISEPDFQISQIADSTHYCSDHIRRVFKTQTGVTPIEYLNNLRIKQACILLKNNENARYTIGDIALMCGFYDSSYFSRFFKKKMGCSPALYRKSKKTDI